MSRTTSVTFTAQPARATSNTRRGAGVILEYDMVTGVQIGDRSAITFKPPEYDRWALTSALPRQHRYNMPASLARRLEVFVQTCYVQGRQGYDGFKFMDYVAGYTTGPTAKLRRMSELS